MRTRSRTAAVNPSIPTLADSLPPEILDRIFRFLSHVPSPTRRDRKRLRVDRQLSTCSVIAPSWKDPARRVLFEEIKISRWELLREDLPEGNVLRFVRTLVVNVNEWKKHVEHSGRREIENHASSQEYVGRLLERMPGLISLRLSFPQFRSFGYKLSKKMQEGGMLSMLRRVSIRGDWDFPIEGLVYDLLAASNQGIIHLACTSRSEDENFELDDEAQLDFGGNLRYLSARMNSTLFLEPDMVVISSLAGLVELDGARFPDVDTAKKVCVAIRKTCTRFRASFPSDCNALRRLPHITHFIIDELPSTAFQLPKSLVQLKIHNSKLVHKFLERCKKGEIVVPSTLEQLTIPAFRNPKDLLLLPPVRRLSTETDSPLLEFLRSLPAGTAFPSKELEMVDRTKPISNDLVRLECDRLTGIAFSSAYYDGPSEKKMVEEEQESDEDMIEMLDSESEESCSEEEAERRDAQNGSSEEASEQDSGEEYL